MFQYVNATSWPSYEGVWVHGFFGQNWFDERRAIASVDQEAKNITLATPTNYAFKQGQRFYYYNVIDELDSAGEYLIDRDNGVLYFYPPSAIASNTDAVLSVLNTALIAITGSNITFSGLLFFFFFIFFARTARTARTSKWLVERRRRFHAGGDAEHCGDR